MKAILYKKSKPNSILEYTESDKPVPKENEILVQIHASSINAADYRLLRMGFPPKSKIFGADIAGVVESVGSKVKNFKPGDKVLGDLADSGFGGFAEFVAVQESFLVHKPENLSFEEAAALPLAGVTALQAIRDKGNVQRKDSILIDGGGGGVGTFAIQIAKVLGSHITVICSERNIEQSKELGADTVIDYNKEDFTNTETRYDLILAVNGNHSLGEYKSSLKENGRFVLIGGKFWQIIKALFLVKLLSFGSKKMHVLMAKVNPKDLKIIARLAQSGKIKPIIERVYPLEQTWEAMQYVAQGHAKGKVVIKVK
ncbi:MAG: NAD(P)-dependent alcohol dehydrogenase [Leptospiraceae bacterium]|nr:NAD(P)-dependent alcohol dehydrogenase [Leptospiraceae bacterium]